MKTKSKAKLGTNHSATTVLPHARAGRGGVSFPIVGIGTSAGGLEAFKKLLHAIPRNSGVAYILVQHLHPEHNSTLPEILQRETLVPVQEISDNVKVEPDNIYIIPANKILVANDGVLQLSARPKDKKNNLIDIFFS